MYLEWEPMCKREESIYLELVGPSHMREASLYLEDSITRGVYTWSGNQSQEGSRSIHRVGTNHKRFSPCEFTLKSSLGTPMSNKPITGITCG